MQAKSELENFFDSNREEINLKGKEFSQEIQRISLSFIQNNGLPLEISKTILMDESINLSLVAVGLGFEKEEDFLELFDGFVAYLQEKASKVFISGDDVH